MRAKRRRTISLLWRLHAEKKVSAADDAEHRTAAKSGKRPKVCKQTKGEHQFEKYKPYYKSSRDARCFCGKILWSEWKCDKCDNWYRAWKDSDGHKWNFCPNPST